MKPSKHTAAGRAFRAGFAAYPERKPDATPMAAWWESGWLAAQKAAEANKEQEQFKARNAASHRPNSVARDGDSRWRRLTKTWSRPRPETAHGLISRNHLANTSR